jgi:hypothetical protein
MMTDDEDAEDAEGAEDHSPDEVQKTAEQPNTDT